jgi:hypothetical protein
MSPENFAKFYPPLVAWIRNTLAASAPVAQSVASRGFSRLRLLFYQKDPGFGESRFGRTVGNPASKIYGTGALRRF